MKKAIHPRTSQTVFEALERADQRRVPLRALGPIPELLGLPNGILYVWPEQATELLETEMFEAAD